MRLTSTRAKNGLACAVSHVEKACRASLPAATGRGVLGVRTVPQGCIVRPVRGFAIPVVRWGLMTPPSRFRWLNTAPRL